MVRFVRKKGLIISIWKLEKVSAPFVWQSSFYYSAFFMIVGESMISEKKNNEYYNDLTAYEAIRNIESEERAIKLLAVLRYIIKNCNFELVGHIHIKDKKTNKVYK